MKIISKQVLKRILVQEHCYGIALSLIIGCVSMVEMRDASFNTWLERVIVFMGLGIVMGTLSTIKQFLLRMAQG